MRYSKTHRAKDDQMEKHLAVQLRKTDVKETAYNWRQLERLVQDQDASQNHVGGDPWGNTKIQKREYGIY